MTPLDRIKRAHIAIMRHKKFCAYSGVMACGKVDIDPTVITACTNGWDVRYAPEFVTSLTDPQLRLLVLHESAHKAYRHLTVWHALHDENPHLANIAADHFVNLALMDTDAGEGFIKMPEVGVQPDPRYRGMSVKQIFDALKEEEEKEEEEREVEGEEDGDEGGKEDEEGEDRDGDGEGDEESDEEGRHKGKGNGKGKGKGKGKGGDSDGDGDGDGEGDGLDSHDWKGAKDGEADAKEAERRANEIQRAIRQGEMLAKKIGKGAGGMDGVFGDLLVPKVDWRKVLREFVTENCAGRDESSWQKPNRRFLADDIYMPSMVGTTLEELVIGFDTSGSCFNSAEMTRFVTEIANIVETIKPHKVHVAYVDTQVAGFQTFEDGQFAVQNLKVKGGGGTHLPVLFEYLADKRIRPTACVFFTDGYTDFGAAPAYPVLWAITTDIRASWGVTIKVEV